MNTSWLPQRLLIRHQVCKRNIKKKTKAKVVIIEPGGNLRVVVTTGGEGCNDKKLGKVFLMLKEIQKGSGAWKALYEEEMR
jgi:hypothetical protein